jgi:hypothetical protein
VVKNWTVWYRTVVSGRRCPIACSLAFSFTPATYTVSGVTVPRGPASQASIFVTLQDGTGGINGVAPLIREVRPGSMCLSIRSAGRNKFAHARTHVRLNACCNLIAHHSAPDESSLSLSACCPAGVLHFGGCRQICQCDVVTLHACAATTR